MELQAELAKRARALVDSKHSTLIKHSADFYAAKFLPDFQVIYIDDGDGDRITSEQKAALLQAGVSLTLADAMPDVLLWNAKTDWLWVIEAVTSDGEVDGHKVSQLQMLAERCGKAGVGFTTTYPKWSVAAKRQGAHKNLAIDTYMWIEEDGSRQFKVETF